MRKKDRSTGHNIFVIISMILFVVIIIALFHNIFAVFYQPLTKNSATGEVSGNIDQRMYQSQIMKFSVWVPGDFTIDETPTGVLFTSHTGTVYLNRVATEFDTPEDYTSALSKLNNLEMSESSSILLNLYPTVQAKVVHLTSQVPDVYTYFIYADGWIYSVSTALPDLYGTVDQIAHSFRYTP